MADRAPVSSSVCYRDPVAAYAWLEEAFGLEPALWVTTPDGKLVHAEMTYRGGTIGVGSAWTPHHASPLDLDGRTTQSVHLQLEEDIDAHYLHARASGARILRELETQSYGDRTYAAMDLEGHIWSFGRTVKAVTETEWDAAGGTVTSKRPQETPHG
jgi:uncharacterized glyoxalase superfamily protein PhnB